MNEEFSSILQTLNDIHSDTDVPKNVRMKISQTISCIEQENELCLKVSQVMGELEDISNDPNIPSDVRIEIMNVMGILGGV
jgi:uncharacterized protein